MTPDADLIIVGGGPAGVMAGLLFARAGCTVRILEKHADFFRDFRGDTVHPSTMEILDQLGMLERFLAESAGLHEHRGPLLVQLPASHAFDARVVGRFFDGLRSRHEGPVVCEPRHVSWLAAGADALLARYQVARVAPDPARAPGLERPGG